MEKNLYNWNNYNYYIGGPPVGDGRVITTELIEESFETLYNDIFKEYTAQDIFYLQLIVKTEDQSFRSITKVILYSNNIKSNVLEQLIGTWNIKNDEYNEIGITHLIYKYKKISIQTKKEEAKYTKAVQESVKKTQSKHFKFVGYNLPTTMNLIEWGDCHFNKDYTKALINYNYSKIYKSKKGQGQFEVKIYDNYTLVNYFVNGESVVKFIDEPFDNKDLTCFKRTLLSSNQVYYIIDGKVELKQIQRKCNYIKKDKLKYFNTTKIITMDLETRIDKDQNFIPYCISMYDGKEFKSYYLSDFTNSLIYLINNHSLFLILHLNT